MEKKSIYILKKYLTKERDILFLFLSTRLLMTGIDIYSPLLIKNLIDTALPNKNINLLIKYSIILITFYIVRLKFAMYSQTKGKLMGSKIKNSMRGDLVEKIINQPGSFFMKHQKGDLLSRVMGDLESVSILCHRGLEDFIFSVITITASIILMFKFNLELTIFSLLPLPIALIFVYIENKKMKKNHGDVRKKSGELSSSFYNILRTISFIKDNSLENMMREEFDITNNNLLEKEKEGMIPSSLLASGITFYSNITQLIIILAGGYLFIKDKITMGIILSFLLLVDRFRLRLMRLVGLIDIYQKGISGVDRFTEIINLDEREDGEIELKEDIETIEFKNVTFSYEDKVILKDFNLDIKKGERVAFVGESGIGKSTTALLIKRGIVPTAGEILINGKRLSSFTFKSYLEKLGVVDQSDYILNKTIMENIKIIKNSSSDIEVKNALEKSYVNEMIESFYNKEKTLIGEDGAQISSGQKQKIALGRIFLKNPSVILLDEATNALDIINEKSILKNIKDDFFEKIVIVITHRLSVLEDFDKIYVLGKETIVEKGNYKELVEKKGKFYKLLNGIRDKSMFE